MDVDDAARALLRGVLRNQGIIVFPFYARLLWWLGRLSPKIPVLVNRKSMQDARAHLALRLPILKERVG